MIGLLVVGSAATPALGEADFLEASVHGGLDEILEHVAKAHRLPVGVAFRQEIVLKAFLLTWRFQSQVQVMQDGYWSETTGAPGFVPDSLAQELVELGQSAALFELTVAQADDGESVVLKGPRRRYEGTGPKEATYWIDPRHWVITQAEATYSWGTLYLTQEYTEKDGVWLLSRQRARVTPYGFTLDVDYHDYQFP